MKSLQKLSTPSGELVLLGLPTGLGEIRLPHAATDIEAYCAGKSRAFTVSLPPVGTPFQHQVWRRLVEKDTTIYEAPGRQFDNPNAAAFVERGQS